MQTSMTPTRFRIANISSVRKAFCCYFLHNIKLHVSKGTMT